MQQEDCYYFYSKKKPLLFVKSATLPFQAEGGNHWLAGNTLYNSRSDCVSAYSAELCDHKYAGDYYNWTAAVASNDSSALTTQYTTAENSICPAGWRLSEGLTEDSEGVHESEFNTLLSSAGIAGDTDIVGNANVGFADGGRAKMEGLPYAIGRFGAVGDTTFYALASHGYYWSSTALSSSAAYNLNYVSSQLYPAGQSSRLRGWNVRCVAR